MAALVVIFSIAVVGAIVLTFRTAGRLARTEESIKELRKRLGE